MRPLSDRTPTSRRPAARALLGALPRRALLAALLPLASGCAASDSPTEPPALAPTLPVPAPAFPPLARSATIYVEGATVYGASLLRALHGGRLVSRFVLYEDHRFALQFSSPAQGLFEYGGQYARTDSGITFAFGESGIAGPWEATGTLSGERLSVIYNDLMVHSDFVDGVYVRALGTP